MTIAEISYAQQGYMRRLEYSTRTAINITRWGAFAIMSSMADMKGMTPQELLPLPWDEEVEGNKTRVPKKVTKRDIERRRSEALELIKLLENNE